jgi:hypothetical protein
MVLLVLLVYLIALQVRLVASLEDVLAQEMNRSISALGQRTLFPLSRWKCSFSLVLGFAFSCFYFYSPHSYYLSFIDCYRSASYSIQSRSSRSDFLVWPHTRPPTPDTPNILLCCSSESSLAYPILLPLYNVKVLFSWLVLKVNHEIMPHASDWCNRLFVHVWRSFSWC